MNQRSSPKARGNKDEPAKRSRQIVFDLPPGELERRAEKEAARAQARAELIRKRAHRAVEGLARWEKRLRYAKRKLAVYRRSVTYYRKQGVLP